MRWSRSARQLQFGHAAELPDPSRGPSHVPVCNTVRDGAAGCARKEAEAVAESCDWLACGTTTLALRIASSGCGENFGGNCDTDASCAAGWSVTFRYRCDSA